MKSAEGAGAATRWQRERSGFVSIVEKKKRQREGYTRRESFVLSLMCCDSGGYSAAAG